MAEEAAARQIALQLPRVALSLPLGQISESEKLRRCRAKAENFRHAAEAKKKLIEQQNSDRTLRSQVFEAFQASISEAEREEKRLLFQAQEKRLVRAMCKVWTTQDFEPIRVLGKGAFGVVHLALQRDTGKFVALKQLPKARYRERNLRERAYAERHILAEAANRWFVELLATFQDQDNFYMVMEFVQGGDLLTHLERKRRFTEDETRFYMAELLEAIDVVHKFGFVHRDIKPDNVVLTTQGHLKLLDFGLCKEDPTAAPPEDEEEEAAWRATTRRQRMRSARGTPQYMAPEAIKGEVCPAGDLWALGVMVYECLSGCVPFHAGREEGHEALMKVAQQVREHAFVFPKRLARARAKGYLSPGAEGLLEGLVCEVQARLTAESCRREPFFGSMDFSSIHLQQPPIVPGHELEGPDDTRFFPGDLGVSRLPDAAAAGHGKDTPLEWTHYEFSREAYDLQQPRSVEALFVARLPAATAGIMAGAGAAVAQVPAASPDRGSGVLPL